MRSASPADPRRARSSPARIGARRAPAARSLGERTTSGPGLRVEATGRACWPNVRRTLSGISPADRFDQPLDRGTVLAETYRLERLLAQGGMGAVYLATDLRLRREVAVKVLLPRLAVDPRIAGLFRDESRAMARVCHPNVVQVFSTGTHGALPFFVMEYVPGVTVAALIHSAHRRGRFTGLDTIGLILRQAAQGLGAIHACGLFHGDVKPSNMLITAAFHVVTSDFGLVGVSTAPAVELAAAAAADPSFLGGTPLYIAPELVRGAAVPPERRQLSDVYSLGASVFELLTGQGPFDGATIQQILRGHLFTTPPRVTDRRPDLSPGIDAVIARALAKDPARRFQGCHQLAAAFDLVTQAAAPLRRRSWAGRASEVGAALQASA